MALLAETTRAGVARVRIGGRNPAKAVIRRCQLDGTQKGTKRDVERRGQRWRRDVPFSTLSIPEIACFKRKNTLITLKICIPPPVIYIMSADSDR